VKLEQQASKPAVFRIVSHALREVSSARYLVWGHVRHGVGHSFPLPSVEDYIARNGATTAVRR
jgi:hypothetical protein